MKGKSFDIKRAGLTLLVFVSITIGVVCVLNLKGNNVITGTRAVGLPEKFNNIHTRDEALKRLGEPIRKSLNPKWENKSKEEWQKLEKESGDLESSNSDPYGAAGKDESYSKLLAVRTSLSHKCKETWFYADTEGGVNGYVFYFDADGNVINVTRYSKPRAPGGPSSGKNS